jgi:beta-glucosidase
MTEFDRNSLGPDFTLGVATSSYQIEGAVNEGGRGPSIWDRFTHTAGKIKQGGTGDVACDHYHRMPEDVQLMDWLGVDAYRFSIAWPRVLPAGRGGVNERGLDFYERLVDTLLEHGIAPCATLYHWDLPDALPGWLERSTASAFAEYASVVARRLGDRVALWLTHNEPWCQAFLGYEKGIFAPGVQDFAQALQCSHHLLVSHGLALQALRAEVKAAVGIAPNYLPAHPASTAAADVAAARRMDGYFNRWFTDPIFGRGYPEDMVALYGADMPRVTPDDLALIAEPFDVLGVNYYERAIIRHDDAGGRLQLAHVRGEEHPRTLDREIYPWGLYDVLERLQREYGAKRLVVTENGAAFADELEADGRVHDAERVEFLRRHLEQVARARRHGINVEGFFAWSLLDNFEWSEGYTLRYGITHVDFATQQRRPKDSALFLRSLGRRATEQAPFPGLVTPTRSPTK